MPSFRNRKGERVGRLTVLCEVPKLTANRVRWLCQCDCGSQIEVNSSDLSLKRTSSCGCLQKERTAAANSGRAKHGHTRHRKSEKVRPSPEYRSWKAMLERCRNPNAPNYHLYGGRGISVCERWERSFATFFSDMGQRPDRTTLDRIDGDGNYEPGNCRWATAKEQSNNRRETPALAAARKANLANGRKRWPRKNANA